MHGPDTSLVGLVLDDEFLIAIEIESILAAAGYQVVSAVSVREARRLLDGDTGVDFAVLDRKALNEVLVSQPRLGNKLLLLLLQLFDTSDPEWVAAASKDLVGECTPLPDLC